MWTDKAQSSAAASLKGKALNQVVVPNPRTPVAHALNAGIASGDRSGVGALLAVESTCDQAIGEFITVKMGPDLPDGIMDAGLEALACAALGQMDVLHLVPEKELREAVGELVTRLSQAAADVKAEA
jgi:hypothetical protein